MRRPAPHCLLLMMLASRGTHAAATPAAPAIAATVTTSPPQQPLLAGKPTTLSAALTRLPERTALAPSAFKVSHEQLLHLVAVGADLDTFLHIHPSSSTASAFTFSDVTFPKAGNYLVALDAKLADGSRDVAAQTKLAVGGSPRMQGSGGGGGGGNTALEAGPAAAAATSVTVKSTPLQRQQPAASLASLVQQPKSAAAGSSNGIYTASVAGPQGAACKPGKAATYVWTLSHGSSSGGKPVTDLRLYYGAPMHLAVVKSDLGFIAHEHGDVVKQNGGGAGATSSNKPAGTANAAPAAEAAADEHAGHGRKLLQEDHSAHTTSGAAGGGGSNGGGTMMGAGGNNGMMMGGGVGASSSNSKSVGFGHAIQTSITLPSAGRYLLVGQVSRGNELILLPVFVSCSG